MVSNNREFKTYTGTLFGEKVSVTSTGIGGPSTAIAVEELVNLGAHTFIRVGTAGAIQGNLETGELVIAQAAVRNEGTSQQYAPLSFPAVANPRIIDALYRTAISLGIKCSTGIVLSGDALYGEIYPDRMPMSGYLKERWETWEKCGCLAAEMECGTLFVVAAARGVNAGAVLTIVNAAASGTDTFENTREVALNDSIKTAVSALKVLIKEQNAN